MLHSVPLTVGPGLCETVIFSQQFILLISSLRIIIGYPSSPHKPYLYPNQMRISKSVSTRRVDLSS